MRVAGTSRRLLAWDRWLLLLPFLGIAVVAALDWANPSPHVTLEPAVTAGPALAGIVSRRTWFPLVVGVVGAGVAFLLATHDRTLHASVHTTSIIAVMLVAVIGAISVRLRARQERALAGARLIAEVAQRVLLRSVPERVGPVRAAVHYAAAAAHARIGGDLYEVVRTRYGVRAVIGDVRGKGLGAVETAASVLGAFREAAHLEPRLDRVAAWLADSLDRSLREQAEEEAESAADAPGPALAGPGDRGGIEEEFVTLLAVSVDDAGVLEMVNCGHPAAMLLRAGQPARALSPERNEPPLGVLPPGAVRPPVLRLRLDEGDRILLYTDGVIEARDAAGRFYPLPERLAGLVGEGGADDPPAEVLARIHDDVRAFVGRALGDDAAMLLLEFAPLRREAPGPAAAEETAARPAPPRPATPADAASGVSPGGVQPAASADRPPAAEDRRPA